MVTREDIIRWETAGERFVENTKMAKSHVPEFSRTNTGSIESEYKVDQGED